MARPMLLAALAALGSCLGGCASDSYERVEGVSTGAGNAIAANTAMQMVDPWQYGVQDTDLLVPAARGGDEGAAAAAGPAPAAGGASADAGSTGSTN